MDKDTNPMVFFEKGMFSEGTKVSLSQKNRDYIVALQRQNIQLECRLKQVEGQMSSLFKSMLSISETNKRHQSVEDKLRSVVLAFNEKMKLVTEEFLKARERDKKIRDVIEQQVARLRQVMMRLEKTKDAISDNEVKVLGLHGAVKELYKKIKD